MLYQLSYFRKMLSNISIAEYHPRQGCDPHIFWGKVVLYQLSYFRKMLSNISIAEYHPRQGCDPHIFWGKVVLYQLSYFRKNLFQYVKSECVSLNAVQK